jgi:hypothetical protein
VTALDTLDRLAGYYPSLFPAECGGPRRQKAPHGRGLGILGGEWLDVTLRDTDRWNVMFLWRDPGELYLHSTSPVAAPHPIGLVERVDPLTLDPLATTEPLPTGGHIWCGAMVVHENGDLYVVNGRYLHRLRFDLTLAAEAELPSDGAHNTLLVGADGNLIVKDNRIGGPVSLLTVLEPDRLAVVAEVSLPEPSMGRVAADRIDGVDLLYVPGDEHVFRYRYRAGSLERDEGWVARYRERDGDQGLAWDTCLGADSVWLHDNGDSFLARHLLAADPVGSLAFEGGWQTSFASANRLLRFGVGDPEDHDIVVPVGRPDGWVLAPPVFVEQHQVAVSYDSSNGQVVAYRYRGPGVLDELWRRDLRNWWQPLVYPDTAEIVLDDVDLLVDDGIVVLDLLTGAEKARTMTGSIFANAMFPCPGERRDLYYVSNPCVARISVVEPG